MSGCRHSARCTEVFCLRHWPSERSPWLFSCPYPTLFHLFKSSQPGCFELRPFTQGLRPNHCPQAVCLDVDVDLLVSCSCLRPFSSSKVAQLFLLSSCQAVCLRLCPATVLLHKSNKQIVEFQNNKHNASGAVRDRQ